MWQFSQWLLIFFKGVDVLKVVYPTCCGVDVHKSFLVATIIKTNSGIQPSYQKKRFSTFNKSLLEFKDWLLKNNCHDICMESTGKYWVPVFNILEDSINVTIANPKWVKAIKGNKDDTKDSKWIGDLFRLGLVKGSFIPNKTIRVLREFTRYRYKIVSCRSSEKNRFQNALTVCNIGLDSVVSDIFGKSSISVIEYLISQTDNSINHEEVSAKLLKSLKSKELAVIESIEGYQMTSDQKYRMRLIQAHLNYTTALINDIDVRIDSIISNDSSLSGSINFLTSIPGVSHASAVTIISEIGTDMSQFCNSKRLCCWAGLTPCSNESAGKKKSVKISRAGVYLKPALVQCAHAAVKSKDNSYYNSKYQQISKRRGKKRAIIAIARMILTAIFHMLSTGEVWNPTDMNKVDIPEKVKEKMRLSAIKKAKKLLQEEGLYPIDSQETA